MANELIICIYQFDIMHVQISVTNKICGRNNMTADEDMFLEKVWLHNII